MIATENLFKLSLLVGLAVWEMLDLVLSETLSLFLDYLAFFYD